MDIDDDKLRAAWTAYATGDYSKVSGPEVLDLFREAAIARLDELDARPADDAEPVTEGWLESIGVRDNGDRSFTLHASPNARYDTLSVVWYPTGIEGIPGPLLTLYRDFQNGVVKVVPGHTRGDVRRLLTALNITPKG